MAGVVVVAPEDLAYTAAPGRLRADPLVGIDDTHESVFIVRPRSGVARTPHRHDRSAEVMYVIDGSGWAWDDGDLTPISAGSLIYVPAGVPHATIPARDEQLVLACFFAQPDVASDTVDLDPLPVETGIGPGGSDGA